MASIPSGRSKITDEEQPPDNALSDAADSGQPVSQTSEHVNSRDSKGLWQVAALLAQSVSGTPFDSDSKTIHVLGIRAQILAEKEATALLDALIHPSFHPNESLAIRTLFFFNDVAASLRKDGRVSFQALGACLAEQRVLVHRSIGELDDCSLEKLLFIAVGWITTLYEADYERSAEPFAIHIRGSACESFQVSTVDSSMAGRSVAELLLSFGDILPFPRIGGFLDDRQESESGVFHVASLNAATLRRVGNLQFEWTDTIGCHLEFDPAHLTIKLYRFPSLCELHRSKSSILIPLLDDYYGNTFKTKNYTMAKFANEVILSYSLLFRCDPRARKEYRSRWRRTAGLNRALDPYLDELCIGSGRTFLNFLTPTYKQPVRESFDASSDFPVLSARLRKIQHFIDSIQPNRVRSLWKDKRDILRWYTFWAVVVLGGFNLVVAIVQTGLSSAQVQLAQVALERDSKRVGAS